MAPLLADDVITSRDFRGDCVDQKMFSSNSQVSCVSAVIKRKEDCRKIQRREKFLSNSFMTSGEVRFYHVLFLITGKRNHCKFTYTRGFIHIERSR